MPGLLIRNARVFTADGQHPWAGAVAVEDERISWVGDDAEAHEHVVAGSEVIDAKGANVLPGFVDAHNHVRLGSNPGAVQLSGAVSLDDLHAWLAAFAQELPEDAWIEGEGWNCGAPPRRGAHRRHAARRGDRWAAGVPMLLRRAHGVAESRSDGPAGCEARRARPALGPARARSGDRGTHGVGP